MNTIPVKQIRWVLPFLLLLLLLLVQLPAQAQSLKKTTHSAVLTTGSFQVVATVGTPMIAGTSSVLMRKQQMLKAKKKAAAAALATAEDLPKEYSLSPNYPNPFNPQTTIRFALPEQAKVSLVVFDMLGREVVRLIDGDMDAGRHEARFQARDLASGVYLYRIQAGSFSQIRKMLLVK